ncbi:MAG: metal ABC transporter ATP-binding protein [Candidatus Latescibacteria bacterium]|nr:metal ABC transporter ATP-binding protein [Candidatus Latescibacterota bacterium]
MDDTAVDLRNVWFSYDGIPVLREVTLAIGKRGFLAVIGPNGGGKTTLLKLIIGRLRPSGGSVTVFGKKAADAALRIGYVPQNTSGVEGFPVTVEDVAMMGRLGHGSRFGRPSDRDGAVVRLSLETAGVAGLMKRRIGELSGGQRQRVYIARALATEPDMLVLDEPTANIDLDGQLRIYELLGRLNETMAVIVATHDVTGVLGFARSMAYVNGTLHVHEAPDMTPELLEKISGTPLDRLCPVEVIARILGNR